MSFQVLTTESTEDTEGGANLTAEALSREVGESWAEDLTAKDAKLREMKSSEIGIPILPLPFRVFRG